MALKKPQVFDNTFPTVTNENLLKRDADSEWMLPYWDKSDALVDGISAVRKGGPAFLPRFNGEENEDYQARLTCTKMTNVYRDIVESLSAKPFEQEISLVETTDDGASHPEEVYDFTEDVDGIGNNMTMFSSQLFFNGLNSAISWIFVDYPNVNADVRTRSDARRENIRPFWSIVLGRNVLSAKWTMVNSKATLSYMRIYEPQSDGGRDRVRIFRRDPVGNVTWELWERTEKSTVHVPEFALIDQGTVTIGVIPLVPFITGRREGRTARVHPVLRDAVDLQVELYQDESALKYNRVMSGYPMISASGINPPMNADGKTIKRVAIGIMKILWGGVNATTGSPGKFEFIQPSAEMAKFLSDDIQKTILNLRELGKQPLTAQSGNLTTVTAAVAAGKSKSAIQMMCLNLKDTLENAMVITYRWLGLPIDTAPSVYVFDEFDNLTEGDTDLQHLREMRKNGDISRETFWEESKRRRVLSSEFTAEREAKRMLAETPGELPVVSEG